jgi:hypothetical protein
MSIVSLRKSKAAVRESARTTATGFWETLEVRQLLSGSAVAIETSVLARITPDASQAQLVPDARSSSGAVQGYTPQQIKSAYGFSGVAQTGAGQTIAIIDAYNDPNIASDLGVFDSQFGLSAPPSLQVVSQTGSTTKLPATSASWAQETALDVEWAHAIAPQANILLVEARNDSTANLLAAVNYARSASGVSVVSMSWGGGELPNETSYDKYFTTPANHNGVTFVAAAGDDGADGGAEWPASSPDVLAVGGTTLTLNGNSYSSETVWSQTSDGTSAYESTPGYQASLGVSGRTTADVSYDADPNTGFPTYDSLSYQGQVGWAETGGTSAGTPQWAGIIALADQARAAANEGTLDGGTATLPALYSTLNNPATYASDFNDITSGSNAGDSGFGGGEVGGGGFGGGGFGGGGFTGGGFGGGGFTGHGGWRGWRDFRGHASWYSAGSTSTVTSSATTSTSSTGPSLTSATTSYDGPTGLGTPKVAGIISTLVSYGQTSTASHKSVSTLTVRLTLRIKPAIRVNPSPAPQQQSILTGSYLPSPASNFSQTPSLYRPQAAVELQTTGSASRATDAVESASSVTTGAFSFGSLSGYLNSTSTEQLITKVAATVQAAVEPAASGVAHIAKSVEDQAKLAAVDFTASVAPLLVGPQQILRMTHIDANATFSDSLAVLTEELASIPHNIETPHSSLRAWVITGIVITADAILLARYRMKKAVFNDQGRIAI